MALLLMDTDKSSTNTQENSFILLQNNYTIKSPYNPVDIAVDRDTGLIYVADTRQYHRISIFSPYLQFITSTIFTHIKATKIGVYDNSIYVVSNYGKNFFLLRDGCVYKIRDNLLNHFVISPQGRLFFSDVDNMQVLDCYNMHTISRFHSQVGMVDQMKLSTDDIYIEF